MYNLRSGAMLWTTVLLVLPFFAYGPLSLAMGDELAVRPSCPLSRLTTPYFDHVRLRCDLLAVPSDAKSTVLFIVEQSMLFDIQPSAMLLIGFFSFP